MIHGMTGFGSVEISRGPWKVAIEVKSVNHRYLDINYYLPSGYVWLEGKFKELLQEGVHRGRVTVWLKIKQAPAAHITVNKAVLNSYLTAIKGLKQPTVSVEQLNVSDLMRLPGVFEFKEPVVTEQELGVFFEKGFKRALKALIHMRKREGSSLAKDVTGHLKTMTAQSSVIKAKAAEILRHKKQGLTDEEYKSLQKSIDISEEIARLGHYVGEAKVLFKNKGPVGKQLDFIAQEMQRETNTIGSKLQEKNVAKAVIALKSMIEKIREQAQNIE